MLEHGAALTTTGPDLADLHRVVETALEEDLRYGPDATTAAGGWFVGCHIPGHWQKGMVVPVRFVGAGGVPLGTPPALPSTSPGG